MNPGSYVLPLVLALPVLGAIFVMCTPKEEHGLHRGIGIGFSLLTLVASLLLLPNFNAKQAGFQEVFDVAWIPGLNAHFKVGVDGISLWLVLLTTVLTPLTLIASSKAIERHVREFVAAFLILEVGMLGAFVAIDIFLFYVMWEVMLIPMYLLIGIWGGQRRLYASIKFVIYTMVGSLCMLAAILYVYTQYAAVTGDYTTDLESLKTLVLPHSAQFWCFAAFGLAFAIKIPLFPWGADAWRPAIMILSVIGIIYGALVAFAQDDVKKLVAYSSVSHLGFCALGLFAMSPQGIEGSVYAMLSHGLTTGGLFLGIGVLYERRHTRRMSEYGGIWTQMPVFAGMYLVIVMGSAGLPGTSGFIGEFLSLFGTFNAGEKLDYAHLYGALAALGVILGAVYLLFMFQKVFFGPLDKAKNGKLPDLSWREWSVFATLIAGILWLGIFPQKILMSIEPSAAALINQYDLKLEDSGVDQPAHIQNFPPPPPVSATAEAAPPPRVTATRVAATGGGAP